MASSSTDWAWLPQLVLDLIVTKIQSLSDHVRFASVCTSWFSIQKTRPDTKIPIPMLLIPNKHSPSTTTLYSVEDDKTYDIGVPSVHNSTRFCGSCHGWLISVDTDLSITLSPQTPKNQRQQQPTIRLPPIRDKRIFFTLQLVDESYTEYIDKMILSADPAESGDYVAVAIYGRWSHLAILKSGDQSWTCSDIDCCYFSDVIWHKDRIYVSTRLGNVFQIDGNNPSPKVLTWVLPEGEGASEIDHGYFVEYPQGQLLLVEKNSVIFRSSADCGLCDYLYPNGKYKTIDFKVYKLELSPSPVINVEKIRVKDIGGGALFVADNQSMVVGASKIWGTCLKNCICYTAGSIYDRPDRVGHMGIFSLEDRSLQIKHLPYFYPKLLVPPIWVTPMISDLVQM